MPAYDLPRIMARIAPRTEPPQSTPQYAESPATSPDDPPLTFDLALDNEGAPALDGVNNEDNLALDAEDDAAIPRPVDPSAPVRMDDVPEPPEPDWNPPPNTVALNDVPSTGRERLVEATIRVPIMLSRSANGDAHRTWYASTSLFDCTMRYSASLHLDTKTGAEVWYWSVAMLDGEMVDVAAPLLPHYRLERAIRERIAAVGG